MTSPWVPWTFALRNGTQAVKAAFISSIEEKARPARTWFRTMPTWRRSQGSTGQGQAVDLLRNDDVAVHGLVDRFEPDLLEGLEDTPPDLDQGVTAVDFAVAVVVEDDVGVEERGEAVGVLGIERLDEFTDESAVVDGQGVTHLSQTIAMRMSVGCSERR